MDKIIILLKNSKRPVIIAGGGIRLAKAVSDFNSFIKMCEIPVVTTAMGLDILTSDNISYMGHAGTKGQRSANMVLQKSDLIISLGSRLCISFIGHNPDLFAPDAKKIVVDVDEREHTKKTIKIDLFLKEDVGKIIHDLMIYSVEAVEGFVDAPWCDDEEWRYECREIKRKYFDFNGGPIYKAISKISKLSKNGDVFTTDSGVTAFVALQTLRMKKDQRFIVPGTLTMGYGLPAVVGIHMGKPQGNIIAIIGDGSFPMAMHELSTIIHHKIPAKIFVINNGGYLAIRTTQKNNFGRLIGESEASGISFPDIKKISKAYGIKYFKNKIEDAMKFKGLCICEIFTPHEEDHLTVKFGKPNDQMFPDP